jgi:choline-sulfatase
MNDQPNILLIVADQLTPFTTGTYGHPVVQTPHLDQLAADGIRYDAAYTSCPLCAPARASLVTGMYASNIGVYDNKSSFSCEQPTVAHYLSLAGYDTVLSGKMHFVGADQLHGFHRRLTGDIFPADFSWQHTDQRTVVEDNNANAYLTAGPSGRSKNQAYDDTVHAQALAYLHSEPPSPFFLIASYQQPHQPFMVPQRVWEAYHDDEIDLPELPDDPAELDALYSTMERWVNRHHGIPPVRDELVKPETLRRMRRAYYGMVTEIDRRVGELLSALDATGQRENTVIIFYQRSR